MTIKLHEAEGGAYYGRHELDDFEIMKHGDEIKNLAREKLNRYMASEVDRDCFDCKYVDIQNEEFKRHENMRTVFQTKMRCQGGKECLREVWIRREAAPSILRAQLEDMDAESFRREMLGTFETVPMAKSIKDLSPGSEARERFETATKAIATSSDINLDMEEAMRKLSGAVAATGMSADATNESFKLFGMDAKVISDTMKKLHPGYIEPSKDRPQKQKASGIGSSYMAHHM